MVIAILLLIACSPVEEVVAPKAGFCREYQYSWSTLIRVYGQGTWVFSNAYHEGSSESTPTRRRIRVLARWPDVRVDFLGRHDEVEAAYVFSRTASFRVKRLEGSGQYLLEYYRAGTLPDRDRFWMSAVNRGWLPFVPLGWFGTPLTEQLCQRSDVRIVREQWVSSEESRLLLLEQEQKSRSRVLRNRFWFERGPCWVLRRMHVASLVSVPSSGDVIELWYRTPAKGVPLVERAEWRRARDGSVVWTSELVSYDARQPSLDVFRPEVFGIPPPRQSAPATRLWLWAVLCALGLLTVLLLARMLLRGSVGPDVDGPS